MGVNFACRFTAARGLPPEERAALRQTGAAPVFDDLENWLDAQLNRISGKSELAKAIRYALGRMKKMRGYLENGFLEFDNNCAERSIRCVALRGSIHKPGSLGSSPKSPTTRSNVSMILLPWRYAAQAA